MADATNEKDTPATSTRSTNFATARRRRLVERKERNRIEIGMFGILLHSSNIGNVTTTLYFLWLATNNSQFKDGSWHYVEFLRMEVKMTCLASVSMRRMKFGT